MTGNCTATIEDESPGGRDKYGNRTDPDDYSPLTTEIAGCAVAPGPSPEIAERARDGQVVDATLYVPGQPDIDPAAVVRIDVVMPGAYEIVAGPSPWESPFTGWKAGTVVGLKRASG